MYSKQIRYRISWYFFLFLAVQVGIMLLIVYREHIFVQSLFQLQKREQEIALLSAQLHDSLRRKEMLQSLSVLHEIATDEFGWSPLRLSQVKPLYNEVR